MRRLALCLALSLTACGGSGAGPGPAAGVPSSFRNDGYAGGSATFQGGFAAGEEAAVTLGPVARAFKVQRVQFLYGGAAGTRTVTLRIYPDAGAAGPGAAVYSGDWSVTASDTVLQVLDLTAEDVLLPAGSFRVSIGALESTLPSVALDQDGSVTAGRNWLFAAPAPFSWISAGAAGLTGDLIIRADVVTR